jgi:hypothetical protein
MATNFKCYVRFLNTRNDVLEQRQKNRLSDIVKSKYLYLYLHYVNCNY